MAKSSQGAEASGAGAFAHFVKERLGPLSQAFAKSPLAQLRFRTTEASITLIKASSSMRDSTPAAHRTRHGKSVHVAHVLDGEPGRAYDTVNAEVVGIFHSVGDLPESGEHVEPDRILGYVEALRLRTPVHTEEPCIFIAQVAEDGQPVEFGETLFIIDRAHIAAQSVNEVIEEQEPPRL